MKLPTTKVLSNLQGTRKRSRTIKSRIRYIIPSFLYKKVVEPMLMLLFTFQLCSGYPFDGLKSYLIGDSDFKFNILDGSVSIDLLLRSLPPLIIYL